MVENMSSRLNQTELFNQTGKELIDKYYELMKPSINDTLRLSDYLYKLMDKTMEVTLFYIRHVKVNQILIENRAKKGKIHSDYEHLR